jgi:hypothetical protein
MSSVSSPYLLLAFIPSVIASVTALFCFFSAPVRRVFGLLSPFAMLVFFALNASLLHTSHAAVFINDWLELRPIETYCGILFNFIYCVVFFAFGNRVFATRTAGYWLLIQLLVSFGLICENMELFALIVTTALVAHLKVSQTDVYQVSRKQDRFVVVIFSSILGVAVALVFFTLLRVGYGLSVFEELAEAVPSLPRYMKVLSSVLMMTLLGAFPFHFWVKPLFGAPARYGLSVITRLNIGLIVWCKLYPMIYSGDPLLDSLLTYSCGANLLYAAFLLFGERRVSQIVSHIRRILLRRPGQIVS